MSHNLYLYGSTDPIYFKLTLGGVGVNPTVVAGDFYLSQDGAAGAALSNLPTAVDGTNMLGIFKWIPVTTETDCEVMILNIKDVAGGAFDENCLIISTGGHVNARFSG